MGEIIKLLYDLLKINSDAFYNELLRLDFAVLTFALTVGFCLLITGIYYFIVDRPKTAKLIVWGILNLITSFGLAVLAYSLANNAIINDYLLAGNEVPNYSTDLICFSFVNFLISAILFSLFSLLLKMFSKNSTYIPF